MHQIRILALVILCNHIHGEADDPFGKYPDFIRDVNSKTTEVLNEDYWDGFVFSPEDIG